MRVAIASGKGGTGKTILATNLACYLSKKAYTWLADLDVEEPNSAIFIKKSEEHILEQHKYVPEWKPDNCQQCQKCVDNCNFNALLKLGNDIMVFPQLCHSCYACAELCPSNSITMQPVRIGKTEIYSRNQLKIISSSLDIGEEQAPPLINNTIRILDEELNGEEFQILDAPPGTSCPMVTAIKSADFVLLVTEPNAFGLHDLTLAVETVKSLAIPFAVVINKTKGNDQLIEDYCNKHNIQVISRIPYDFAVARNYAKAELVYEKSEGFKNCLIEIENFLIQVDML